VTESVGFKIGFEIRHIPNCFYVGLSLILMKLSMSDMIVRVYEATDPDLNICINYAK